MNKKNPVEPIWQLRCIQILTIWDLNCILDPQLDSVCCHSCLIRRLPSMEKRKHLENICKKSICLSLGFFQCFPSIQGLNVVIIICMLIHYIRPSSAFVRNCDMQVEKKLLITSKFPRHATDSFNRSNYFSKCLSILTPRGRFQVFLSFLKLACLVDIQKLLATAMPKDGHIT